MRAQYFIFLLFILIGLRAFSQSQCEKDKLSNLNDCTIQLKERLPNSPEAVVNFCKSETILDNRFKVCECLTKVQAAYKNEKLVPSNSLVGKGMAVVKRVKSQTETQNATSRPAPEFSIDPNMGEFIVKTCSGEMSESFPACLKNLVNDQSPNFYLEGCADPVIYKDFQTCLTDVRSALLGKDNDHITGCKQETSVAFNYTKCIKGVAGQLRRFGILVASSDNVANVTKVSDIAAGCLKSPTRYLECVNGIESAASAALAALGLCTPSGSASTVPGGKGLKGQR